MNENTRFVNNTNHVFFAFFFFLDELREHIEKFPHGNKTFARLNKSNVNEEHLQTFKHKYVSGSLPLWLLAGFIEQGDISNHLYTPKDSNHRVFSPASIYKPEKGKRSLMEALMNPQDPLERFSGTSNKLFVSFYEVTSDESLEEKATVELATVCPLQDPDGKPGRLPCYIETKKATAVSCECFNNLLEFFGFKRNKKDDPTVEDYYALFAYISKEIRNNEELEDYVKEFGCPYKVEHSLKFHQNAAQFCSTLRLFTNIRILFIEGQHRMCPLRLVMEGITHISNSAKLVARDTGYTEDEMRHWQIADMAPFNVAVADGIDFRETIEMCKNWGELLSHTAAASRDEGATEFMVDLLGTINECIEYRPLTFDNFLWENAPLSDTKKSKSPKAVVELMHLLAEKLWELLQKAKYQEYRIKLYFNKGGKDPVNDESNLDFIKKHLYGTAPEGINLLLKESKFNQIDKVNRGILFLLHGLRYMACTQKQLDYSVTFLTRVEMKSDVEQVPNMPPERRLQFAQDMEWLNHFVFRQCANVAELVMGELDKRHPKARYLNRLRFVLQCGFQADYLSAITQFGMNPKWDFNRTVREYLE